MRHDIIVTVYETVRPGATKHSPKDYSAFTGVSMLSTRPEGVTVNTLLRGTGWKVDTECNMRKAVKIELPDTVYCGVYTVGGVKLHGLFAAYSCNDGMGPSVYAYCKPIQVSESYEDAINNAIASGIMLSVPQQDGSRADIKARVVAVSDLYTDRLHNNWTPEF